MRRDHEGKPRRTVRGTELRSSIRRPPSWAIPAAGLALLALLLGKVPPQADNEAFAFAGSALLFVSTAKRRQEYVAWCLTSPIVMFVYLALHSGNNVSWLRAVPFGFGGAAIALSAVSAGYRNASVAQQRRLGALACMPALLPLATIALTQAARWTPQTLDGTLASIDSSFGVLPSFVVGRWLAASKPLWWACKIVYDSLPFALCAAAALEAKRSHGSNRSRIFISVLAAASIGFLFFQIAPACGPRFGWRSAFPDAAPSRSDLLIVVPHVALDEFRNAFPSLHMSGALLLVWALRPLRLGVRVVGWMYAGLTVLATLGSGEHYLIDLVVAAPFMLSIELFVRGAHTRRSGAALVGAVAVWLWLVRAAPRLLVDNPFLTWALSLGTVVTVAAFVPLIDDAAARGAQVGLQRHCDRSAESQAVGQA